MRAKALLWVLTLSILAFPRTSYAGLLDVIWEMSGPQLLGLGLICDIGLEGGANPECSLVGKRLGWRDRQVRRVWLNLLAAPYFSTGKDNRNENDEQIHFSAGRVRMIGIDPMVAVRMNGESAHRLHSAIGVSYNRFFGPDFDAFNNVAIKIRPLGYDRPFQLRGHTLTFEVAYNLRLYPDGFDASPTGALTSSSDFEAVHGFLIGLSF